MKNSWLGRVVYPRRVAASQRAAASRPSNHELVCLNHTLRLSALWPFKASPLTWNFLYYGPQGPSLITKARGLNTDISMREGEPVIVGTLNVGPSGDAIILVMSARRTNNDRH